MNVTMSRRLGKRRHSDLLSFLALSSSLVWQSHSSTRSTDPDVVVVGVALAFSGVSHSQHRQRNHWWSATSPVVQSIRHRTTLASTSSNASTINGDSNTDFATPQNGDSTADDDDDDDILDVVMKFGGSSLADAGRIDHVAHLIRTQIATGACRPRAVVCSAMGKTTNHLLEAGQQALKWRQQRQQSKHSVDNNDKNDDKVHFQTIQTIRDIYTSVLDTFSMSSAVSDDVTALLDECSDLLRGVRLLQELSPKSLDQLVSYGERCAVRVMAERLRQIGVTHAQAFDAWDVGIRTDSEFGNAQLLVADCRDEICASFARMEPGTVAVVTGFIGHDPHHRVTTLGRGGSDLTATTLGAALGVDEVQVWKDVDGILTSDPRLVTTAKPLKDVSYEEAAELAYFGAQVLHPIAMQPAMQANVPVRVKNSYNPEAVGTLIRNVKENNLLVTAITFKRNIKLMDIQSTQMLGAYGFLAKVFVEFEKRKLSVDVLASSEVSVSLTLDKNQKDDEIERLMSDLAATCADVKLSDNKSILTLIADVRRSSQVLATVFRVFSSQGINVEMMSQGASKVNISFILDGGDLDSAVLELHKCFFEEKCIVEPLNDSERVLAIEQR